MLSTGTYCRIDKDPTQTHETRVARYLKRLEKEDEIPSQLYRRIRPTGSRPPLLYGLPKIHKADVPLRPIVACIGAPSYGLSKFVATLISPLAGRTDSFVKNSTHFVEIVKDLKLEDDDVMISFDVKSLFTNVPITESLHVISKMLEADDTLDERTILTSDRIVEMLEKCLRSTYFSYKGVFYEQREGAAMGSPVSAIVANLYMEFFEQLAIESSPVRPRVWLRYVDDTYCILKRGMESQMLDHLNGIRPEIQFTMETEKDGKLPFLDCEVMRKKEGGLSISVYRKSTHTDRYLHFDSHHPVHVKRGVVKCLFNRAEKVTTEVEDLEGEREHLKEVFGWNGYPKSFISNSTNRDGTQDQSSADEVRVVIPYVRGLSEDIRRVCRQFGIRTVFKSAPTLREKLTRVKDKLPMGKLSNVVYQVPCTCGKIYIGETVRRLDTRLKEHKDACICGQLDKSAIAEHAWSEHHPILWESTKVIDRANRQDILRLKEALHIRLTNKDERFNRDVGMVVPDCWVATINHPPSTHVRMPAHAH